jgi:tetratricopeptide (TPR) repeat protein
MGMNLSGRYKERIKGIEGEALEKLILRSVRKLLIKAADRTPLVIVIEDLHWIDTSSIELLESLLRLAEKHRILFVNVFRPDHRETGDRLIETIKERLPVYYVEIMLEPLDERMSEALVANMLKHSALHHPIIEPIVQRASGNPFFIEEIVRSLIDEGAIVLKDGTFQVTEKMDTIAIPNTINDLLMVRIDRLEEETRQLVKVASVIGRNFFHRILFEVLRPLEDIDGILSYLKEIEILRERKRMDEVEYLFTHALAQEAAYESILPRRRKEIHLKVADSIEKVFNERIHEFYGMLSYHYSMAENLDKAEEYLIKAGEEARRSAASDEALHFYEEALRLYLKKSGNDADQEKVAMLEKNIALAMYDRGQHEEAVGHFDRALDHYWGKLPKTALSRVFKFLSSFLHLATALYVPYLKFKATPTQQDLLVFDLFYKKCKALAITNPKRFFIEFFFLHKKITAYDLQKLENGTSLFVSASPLFSFSGISFRLSRRLLDFVRHRVCEDDVRASTIYEICETMHHFLEGNWKEIRNYDDDLIKKNCDIGGIWDAAQILYWHALPCIYQGSLEIVESILNRLEDLFQVYQYNLAKTYGYELKSCLLTESRRFNDALIEIKEGIDFEERSGPGFWGIYVCEARIYISLGEIEKAAECLKQANRICHQIRPVPFQMTGLYRAEVEYNLYRFQEMLGNGNKKMLSRYRKKAVKSVNLLLRNVRKVAQYRTESYKLTGEYYWMMNKQKKALAWWHRAIREGERLGARLQLAGVYFELGKRLLGPGSKYRVLDGIGAEDYLELARSTLEEMKLQSYLDELNQINRG